MDILKTPREIHLYITQRKKEGGEDRLAVYSGKAFEAYIQMRVEEAILQETVDGLSVLSRFNEDRSATLVAVPKEEAHALTLVGFQELLDMNGKTFMPKSILDVIKRRIKDEGF